MTNLEPEGLLKKEKTTASPLLNKAILVGYLGGALIILQSFVLAWIINAALFHDSTIMELTPFYWALIGIFAMRFALTSLSAHWLATATARIQQALRTQLYTKLQNAGPIFISAQGSGSLINALAEGVEAAGKYYREYLPAKALVAALPLSFLVVVLPADWISAIVMVVTAPLIPVFMILIGKKAEALNQRQWQRLARMGNHFLDAIQGLTTLKLFGAARRETQAIAQTAELYRRDTMAVLRVAFLSSVTLEFFATVSIALIAVFIGFRLMWAELDFFKGFFVLLLAPEFYLPLRKMGTAYHARMEAVSAAEKMVTIAQPPAETSETQNAAQEVAPTQPYAISFKQVVCAYEGKRKALHGIDFTLPAGSKTAIVGPSGAGKTTVFSLLLRFVQAQSGEILVNDRPLEAYALQSWRESIAWIPQNPTLFHGSVLDNIRLGKPQASQDEVAALCCRLGIDDFISALPEGYDTLVGEKGYGLSGGQIQRLAIARAFLRDAPLLLLDEPTASLDHKTEMVLQRAMRDLARDKTVLTIAHRLHTIRSADQIIVLDKGHLQACAPHKQLEKDSALYRALLAHDVVEDTL